MNSKYLIILYIFIAFFSARCSMKYRITSDSLSREWGFARGFEISKLLVSSVNETKKYPEKYAKSEVYICIIGDLELNGWSEINYSNIDSYWHFQDSLDYNSGKYLSNDGIKKISFYHFQENVKWIKLPFEKKMGTKPYLEMKFEPGSWYKMSHFYPIQYDLNFVIYIYVERDGKLKSFQALL